MIYTCSNEARKTFFLTAFHLNLMMLQARICDHDKGKSQITIPSRNLLPYDSSKLTIHEKIIGDQSFQSEKHKEHKHSTISIPTKTNYSESVISASAPTTQQSNV